MRRNSLHQCNICGKAFDEFDEQLDFSFDKCVGYGSQFDLAHVKLHMCCSCFDQFISALRTDARIDPIINEDTGKL